MSYAMLMSSSLLSIISSIVSIGEKGVADDFLPASRGVPGLVGFFLTSGCFPLSLFFGRKGEVLEEVDESEEVDEGEVGGDGDADFLP
jgi:hypothetical protein